MTLPGLKARGFAVLRESNDFTLTELLDGKPCRCNPSVPNDLGGGHVAIGDVAALRTFMNPDTEVFLDRC